MFQYLFSSPGAENGLKCFLNAINQSAGRRLVESVKIEINSLEFIDEKLARLGRRAKEEVFRGRNRKCAIKFRIFLKK